MRETWIDNAKGIAILLVIIGHVSGGLKGFWNFNWVYGIHLVVFFLLSGYTLKKKEITLEFLNEKFSRLMKPYFYTCMAVLVTDVVNSCVLNHNMAILKITNIIGNDLLRSFFASGAVKTFSSINLGTRIGAIWFLPALLFAILLMQIMLNNVRNTVFIGLITFAISITSFITARFIWLPFSIQAGMMASFFLWLGFEIKNRNLLSEVKGYHYICAFITVLIGVHYKYCSISFVTANMKDWFFSPLVGLAGCLLVYLIAINIKGGLLAYLGRLSLVILCTHLYALETMGPYFAKILARTGLTGNSKEWLLIAIEIIFAILTAVIIVNANKGIISLRSKFCDDNESNLYEHRDFSVDVAKGILILTMLIGHVQIDARLRTIIYSFHMMAFVFLSGYYFNKNRSLRCSLNKLIRSFIVPYFIFFVFVLLLNIDHLNTFLIKEKALQYFLGISFSKRLFSGVPSVGPVYFILMLFMVRVIYLIVDKYANDERIKWLLVICISFLGLRLGYKGYWLPWSFDVACYSILFYKIGFLFKEKGWLDKIRENHLLYFVLSPIWVYMIYKGGMEIAIRKYGDYGLVVIGSIAGILIVYKFSVFIAANIPVAREFLKLAGKNTLIILMVHTLLYGKIASVLSPFLNPRNVAFMGSCILIQVVLAFLVDFSCQKFIKIFGHSY